MFEQILRNHFLRYPGMNIQDVYKLTHQAIMGNAHYCLDQNMAKESLEKEIAGMGDGPEEPMIDPISSEGDISRVHLRPYLSQTRDIQPLLDAFIRSAQTGVPKTDHIESAWVCVIQSQLWDATELETFISRMRAQGFPSVHHSEEFRKKFRPAYRVINRKYLHF